MLIAKRMDISAAHRKPAIMSEKRKITKGESPGFQLKKSSISSAEPDPVDPSVEDSNDLPHSYGVDTIFLIAQDPHWLFTYWDIDISKHPGGATFLRCCAPDGEVEQEIEVPFETRNWYIPVKRASTDYYVAIGYHRNGTWNEIARSATVPTPPEELSQDDRFDFATVPLHLSFQRLADNLHSVIKSGENLMQAVSRMQKAGDFSAFGGVVPPLMTPEHKALLASMLGMELVADLTAGTLDSSELHSRVQARLEELLSSGGASEAISLLESLSSYSGASAFASEAAALRSGAGISSWSPVEMASWAAGWITSWAGAEQSSSMMPGAAHLTGESSSWSAAALSSWLTAATSSGGASGMSSESLSAVTSWMAAVQSSWAEAATSSWAQAGSSSWLAETGSSGWSASSGESSSLSAPAAREFFMHVNAEVIFYGGTDPRASLTIDGKPVPLQPDGTFRFHGVFPNADYEIPIVATSPDGQESRAATLRFHRDTQKVGIVTDSGQPPLAEPVGRIH